MIPRDLRFGLPPLVLTLEEALCFTAVGMSRSDGPLPLGLVRVMGRVSEQSRAVKRPLNTGWRPVPVLWGCS